ncbi:MAG: NifU N-terminal domain-containing protein [Phycisphaeraceae bacterium]
MPGMFGRLKITVEETPNPNARKFNLTQPLTPGDRRSYYTPDAAADDPIAARLFEIRHVTAVMLLGDFCTVNKTPQGRWTTITPKVKAVLKAAVKGKGVEGPRAQGAE